MEPFEILYEDAEILVCRKPAGIAVQTKRLGQPDMESLLKNYRADRGEEPNVGIVHRLDQPVEGVMVFAKTARAAAALSEQFRTRSVEKRYRAFCEKPKTAIPASGTLCDYMVWDSRANLAAVAERTAPGAKKAVLDYAVEAEYADGILLDLSLHTGRHHQIRLQLSHLGCPIRGDGKYGGGRDGLPRGIIALCAYRLEFTHPASGERMSFEIPFSYPHIS